MFFFQIYILEKYFKDKFTIKYFFSVHAHRYHANLGKHGCLVAKWSGNVIRFRPTHYDLGMSLQYAYIKTKAGMIHLTHDSIRFT